MTPLQFFVDDAQQRQHILLAAQGHSVVHLAVEMDGQVGNLQNGTLHVHQPGHGMERILAAQDYAAGNGQWAVEPCAQDGTPVYFGVEPHQPPFLVHLGPGLDAEGGRVAMGTDDAEPCLAYGLLSQAEGIDGGIVLGDVHFATCLQSLKGQGGVNACISRTLQRAAYLVYC